MPRRPCRRRIGFIPDVAYFKPAGIPMRIIEEVSLGHDEAEAIRLKDLLGLSQEDAASQMGISQPTLHRLLNSAHQKIADAIINGKALRIEGGNVEVMVEGISCGPRHRWHCRGGFKGVNMDGYIKDIEGGAMKIAITSTDGTMNGMVDERFGRCRKIIIYDTETGESIVIDNAVNTGSPQGAGIQTAQNVINAGAMSVISGHLGPKAYQVLNQAGVAVYVATGMTVSDAISAFKEGRLAKLTSPDVSGHW